MPNLTMVIYIQYKFPEIPLFAYLVMAEDKKKSLKFRQSKGKNSPIHVTDDISIKLHVHNPIKVMMTLHFLNDFTLLNLHKKRKLHHYH